MQQTGVRNGVHGADKFGFKNLAGGIVRIMQCGWYKEVRVKDFDSHAVKNHKVIALILAIATALFSHGAHALVGTVDTEDRFPFVVRLSITFNDSRTYGCSGAVSRAGLVSTAAHCIWRSDAGLAQKVLITYRDADGLIRTTRELKIFYPKAFEDANRHWDMDIQSNTNTGGADIAHKQDVAFIVPAQFIEVEGFPHWASELLENTRCPIDVSEANVTGTPPERCAGKFSEQKFKRELGSLNGLKAVAVGYGNFDCVDFSDRDHPNACKSDGQRRYAEVPVVSGFGNGIPEAWCTGISNRGVNPIQHGDSGGPLFIRALDGRWIFVGYHSGGNNSIDCASSILSHLDLWRAAALYISHVEYPFNGATNWWAKQTRRYIEELLASWSSPNDEALPALSTFYPDTSQDIKKRFFEKWPIRRFTIQPGSDFEVGGSGEPVNSDEAHFIVSWSLKEPNSGARADGIASMTVHIRYGLDNEVKLAYGIVSGVFPEVLHERCRAISGDDAIVEFNCPKAIRNAWDHNGSFVILRANPNDPKREFYYENPRKSLLPLGVKKGTLLFSGKRKGNEYLGTAYVFNKQCGALLYQVHGPVSQDQRLVTLYGQAPRVDSNCRVIGFFDDTLIFSFKGD